MSLVLRRYDVPRESGDVHLEGLAALRPNGQPLYGTQERCWKSIVRRTSSSRFSPTSFETRWPRFETLSR